MNERDTPGKIEQINDAQCKKLIDTARELLPAMEVDVVDISDIPGFEDIEPSLAYSASREYEVDDTLVQIREEGEEFGSDINISTTVSATDEHSGLTILKTKYYMVGTDTPRSKYYERIRPAHNVAVDDNSMQAAIDSMTLAESLGETILTSEKLNEVLELLKKCSAENVHHR